MAVEIPTDILFAASQIIDDILDPAWAEDDDEKANYVALAIVAERQRWVDLLTPSGDTKALYHGEFSFPQTVVDEDGNERTHKVYVPWDTIKEVMTFIRARGES